MSNTQNAERVSPLEQLVRLAERSGLLDCIDDAYLERGDWQPLVIAFAEAVQSAERERCAKLCDSAAGNHRDHTDQFRRGAGHCAAAIRAA